MSPARRPAAASAGFSLIEVLVALVIVGISLAILFQVFSLGLRNAGLAEQRMSAAAIAQSHLAALSARTTAEPYQERGDAGDGFRWTAEATPFELDDDGSEGVQRSVVLYRLSVSVEWNDGGRERSFELESLRTLPAP